MGDLTKDEMYRYIGAREAELLANSTVFERTDWSCFRVFLGATQLNLANGVDTKVLFDSSDLDLNGEFDLVTNNEFVANEGGVYQFGSDVAVTDMLSGDIIQTLLFKNGLVEALMGRYLFDGFGSGTLGRSVLVELAAGDTVDLRARPNGTVGGMDILAGRTSTFFWGKKIRERINP